HKRKIRRFVQSGSLKAMPSHYYLGYFRGGDSRLGTAWIPIGDTPAERGGGGDLEGWQARCTRMGDEFRAESGDLALE
ncbi:dehydrogenase, partial [Rhizobium ruizarguesonis]